MDDVAVLGTGRDALVLTHDMMVEGVHYLPEQGLDDVAWKLVASNLSDLAAKGAAPVGVLLGYMLGDKDEQFLAGLRDVLGRYSVPLLGGDTVSGSSRAGGKTGGLCGRSFGLTAIGRVTTWPVPLRSGAKAGDNIYLTGPVGGAMMGYEALVHGTDDDSTAFRRPVPLLPEGYALAPHVHAMMDVSDGVLLDASRMAKASGVTIALDSALVPIDCPENRRADALRWGDDYQLLFTLPVDVCPPVAATPIGQVLPQVDSALLVDGASAGPDDTLGYQHG